MGGARGQKSDSQNQPSGVLFVLDDSTDLEQTLTRSRGGVEGRLDPCESTLMRTNRLGLLAALTNL